MLQNLHTHINMCDGKNTAEEMLLSAIGCGFDSLGFSSHSRTLRGLFWELDSEEEYKREITALKSRYGDRIKIYLGLEADYMSAGLFNPRDYDYIIGSVHTRLVGEQAVAFDNSASETAKHIREVFNSEPLRYTGAYYELVADMPRRLDFDIVGHFDVVSKFSERAPDLIDFEDKRYINQSLEALHAVREKKEFFEVNTGAIARGYKSVPYPAPHLLKEMKTLNCKLVLTSDSHSTDSLSFAFSETKEYLRSLGFDTLYYLGDSGFFGEKI